VRRGEPLPSTPPRANTTVVPDVLLGTQPPTRPTWSATVTRGGDSVRVCVRARVGFEKRKVLPVFLTLPPSLPPRKNKQTATQWDEVATLNAPRMAKTLAEVVAAVAIVNNSPSSDSEGSDDGHVYVVGGGAAIDTKTDAAPVVPAAPTVALELATSDADVEPTAALESDSAISNDAVATESANAVEQTAAVESDSSAPADLANSSNSGSLDAPPQAAHVAGAFGLETALRLTVAVTVTAPVAVTCAATTMCARGGWALVKLGARANIRAMHMACYGAGAVVGTTTGVAAGLLSLCGKR
jgi:hypothetical protein